MTPQTRNFALVSPTDLAAKVKAAGGPQLDPTQPTGTATADGVTVTWEVSPNRIAITVTEKPWIVSWDTIWAHVQKLFPS
jgi:hypothetical protein